MTQTVLHIDSSARLQGSVSRDLSAQIVAKLAPATVIRRDLSQALPFVSEDWMTANFTPADQRDALQRDTLALSDALIGELEAADILVIGVPIYNFGIPAVLKAWADMVARAGVTFRYTQAGPEGLLAGKRAIVAVASGGTKVGSEIDFASGYIRHFLGFLGIEDVQIVAADQLMITPEASLEAARDAVARLAA
jgi:FMN-dependent NADH-azoreductase